MFAAGERDVGEPTPAAFLALMRFQVERTCGFLERGWPLVERLPGELQVDVELFIRGGLGILRKIETVGYNVLAGRPALAKWEKGLFLLQAVWQRLRRRAR